MAFNVSITSSEDNPTRSKLPSKARRKNRWITPSRNAPAKQEKPILEVETAPLETVVNKYPVRVFKVGF